MNTEIEKIFNNYPEIAKSKLIKLRELIYTVAKVQNLGSVEESYQFA